MVRTKPKPPTVSADDARLDVLQAQLEDNGHSCSRCKTPFGKSAIPCSNDPATKEAIR